MPIRFRCGYCNRLLAIAKRKAGVHTACPHCGATIAVPGPDDPSTPAEVQSGLAEIDQLLKSDRRAGASASPSTVAAPAEGFSTTPVLSNSATPAPTSGLQSAQTQRKKQPDAATEPLPTLDDKPLFEHALDGALGAKPAKGDARPTPMEDVLSLDAEPQGIVLSPAKLAAFVMAAVVLVILSFVAGYFVGAK